MKMRVTTFMLVLLLCAGSSGWARLGETAEQLQTRLGAPAKSQPTDSVLINGKWYPVGQCLNFSKEGWSVQCVMVNGLCARIRYVKNAPNPPMTDDDINTILANEAQGFKWTQSTSYTTIVDSVVLPTMKVKEWKRSDGAQGQSNTNSFTLTTPDYQRAVEAAKAQGKKDAEKKMPDL